MPDTPVLLPGTLTDGHQTTDSGNADRLVANSHGRIRYVHAWGKWIVYRQGQWHIDYNDALITDTAKSVARQLHQLYAETDDRSDRDAIHKWARRCESRSAIANMITLARGIPSVLTDHNDLDADPWILNTRNGTINLKTGRLRDHDPDDLCTKQAPLSFDENAQAPRFHQVLERALPDADVRRFLARWAGSAVTGIAVQALLLLIGAGANSKSVLMGALQAALGDGYATVPHKSLLVASRHEQHPTHLAGLKGARLLISPETEAGDRLNEELVKNLTGGDRLRARRMREDEWSFSPTWSAAMHTNYPPRIRGTDEGIWRRLHQIPFEITIPPGERDEGLLEHLVANELAGILNWMIAGCLDWQKHDRHLNPPQAVTQATRQYRVDQDHIGRFIEARCVTGNTQYQVSSRTLREAYEAWCREEGENSWSAKAVAIDLQKRGCQPTRIGTSQARGWSGIGLYATQTEQPPLAPY